MSSDGVNTTDIPEATEVSEAMTINKPPPASLVYSTRWKDSAAGLASGANMPWSLKGPVAAPEVSCPPVPTTVIIPINHSQEVRQEQIFPEAQSSGPDPDTSINSSFNISLISDTSTSASEDDELLELPVSLTGDIFTPIVRHQPRFESSCENDDLLAIYDPQLSPERVRPQNPSLIKHGLGLSGVPKKNSVEGPFDGLGLVGVRSSGRVWRHDVESIEEVDEEKEEEEWETNSKISQTFLHEAVCTWLDDPSRNHILASIPEGDGEVEPEASQLSNVLVESPETTFLDLGKDEDIQPQSTVLPENNSILFGKPVHSAVTIGSPKSTNMRRNPQRKATITRDFSAATVSSGLKRSPPRASHSITSSPSPSPSSSSLNLSPSPSRIPVRKSSLSISRASTPSPSPSLPSVRRPLTPLPSTKPRPRSATPIPTSGMSKSRPTTPVGNEFRPAGKPGVRRSVSLGSAGTKQSGGRGWRV